MTVDAQGNFKLVPAPGGSANTASGTVDFGFMGGTEQGNATVVIPATWVTALSLLSCQIVPHPTDHGAEDPMVEGLLAYTGDIIPGVSFSVFVRAPYGTWGRYIINCLGA